MGSRKKPNLLQAMQFTVAENEAMKGTK